MPAGKYVLTSSVTDHERQQHAIGTVYVEVIEISQEAFDNQVNWLHCAKHFLVLIMFFCVLPL